MIRMALAALLVTAAACSACGGTTYKRTYPEPPGAE